MTNEVAVFFFEIEVHKKLHTLQLSLVDKRFHPQRVETVLFFTLSVLLIKLARKTIILKTPAFINNGWINTTLRDWFRPLFYPEEVVDVSL